MSEAGEYLADLRADLAAGEDIHVRRYTGTERAMTQALVRARVRDIGSAILAGAIVQGKWSIIAINDPSATVPSGCVALSTLLPITTKDKVVVRGKEVAIEAVDDSTRRYNGVLIGINLQAAG